VTFPDGRDPIERIYSNGASAAVDNMGKAIDYYEKKGVQCSIALYTHNGMLIIRKNVPDTE
jgi:hypothetical protein